MRMSKLKLALPVFALLAVVGLSLGGLAHTTPEKPLVSEEEKEKAKPPVPAAVAVAPAPRAVKEFDEFTIVIKTSAFSNQLPSTIKIEANGKLWYTVRGRPAVGNSPAWAPATIGHKLPPDQFRRLNKLLKDTDWLTKAIPKNMPQLHSSDYTLTLKRDGAAVTLSCLGEPEPYKELLFFFCGIAEQEFLVYKLEWEPATHVEARQKLDAMVRNELGPKPVKPPLEIDYARYAPWATRLVRKPFDCPSEDVATAIRVVSLLKLESEREYLADLASDRDWYVREAVAQAMGRLGGEKSVAVLRKMVRSTSEAPWELIKLGQIAVPAIAEVIQDGDDPEQSERMVRAYIDHWAEVPKPLDAKILDAVRAAIADPKVKRHRTQYHEQLLKLATEKEQKK